MSNYYSNRTLMVLLLIASVVINNADSIEILQILVKFLRPTTKVQFFLFLTTYICNELNCLSDVREERLVDQNESVDYRGRFLVAKQLGLRWFCEAVFIYSCWDHIYPRESAS